MYKSQIFFRFSLYSPFFYTIVPSSIDGQRQIREILRIDDKQLFQSSPLSVHRIFEEKDAIPFIDRPSFKSSSQLPICSDASRYGKIRSATLLHQAKCFSSSTSITAFEIRCDIFRNDSLLLFSRVKLINTAV